MMPRTSCGVRELAGEVWHVVGSVDDLPAGSHWVVDVGDRSVGVFNIDGELYAVRNICPHQTGPVCESRRTTGTLVASGDTHWRAEWTWEGQILTCPWHGLEYHVPTARCLGNTRYRLQTYRVRVDANEVLVSLDRPADRSGS